MLETGSTDVRSASSPAESVPAGERPLCWVACPRFGEPTQVWMWRQLVNLRRLRARVVCWGRSNPEEFPFDDDAFDVLPFPVRPQDERGRWVFRLRNLPGRNFYGSVGAERRMLVELARRTDPRVFLCHFGQTALRLLPVARACGVPLVAHFHGRDLSSMLRNHWYRASLLHAIGHFAAIVVVGTHQRRWLLEHGAEASRIHVIPCGAVLDWTARGGPKAEHPVRFLTVSRLTEGKGVSFTIRAFAAAVGKLPDAELHVVGDGPERAALERLAGQLGLGERVRFHGHVPASQVDEHYLRSHVFVQHSVTAADGWCEGFGVSVAEAAAAGLPVVTTRSGGIPDQVVDGETGFCVAERDVDGTAAAMERLARDPLLRHRLGEAGRERVRRLFDANRSAERLEEVLLAVIRTGRASDAPRVGAPGPS